MTATAGTDAFAEQTRALRQLLVQSIDALATGGEGLGEKAAELRDMIDRPPRVAVIGRLKSGKSTLVNALTETDIAATGSLECTMAVSIYEQGAPARAEIHGSDGRVDTVALAGRPLEHLGRPLDEVDYIRQFVPVSRLDALGVIDTPGTATLTVENEQRTRSILVEGSRDTRRASAWADCVVFLSDSAPRADERELLTELNMTPLTTVGVISRADSFGAGAFGTRDPIDHAGEYAGRIADLLGGTVSTVMPLSGLLAESALTGRVNEDTARALRPLAGLTRDQLIDAVELPDPSGVVPGLTAASRDNLLDTLGEYGVYYGRTVAAESGSVGLMHWMLQVSGIERLSTAITGEMAHFAVLQRAVRFVETLDSLAGRPEFREHVRWVQSVLLSQPVMNTVLLYRSFRDTVAGTPDSQLIPRLRHALQGRTAPEKLGLDPGTGEGEFLTELRSSLELLRQLAMAPLSSAEDDARERLIVLYQALWTTSTNAQ